MTKVITDEFKDLFKKVFSAEFSGGKIHFLEFDGKNFKAGVEVNGVTGAAAFILHSPMTQKDKELCISRVMQEMKKWFISK